MPLDAQAVIDLLDLKPLPQEGGYYRETYRADLVLPGEALPAVYAGDRQASTAIYYLLAADICSALHVLPTDEVFHFYLGDPVEMLQLAPDGTARQITLGSDLARGMRPQVVVPGGTWQGARLAPGGTMALMGTTVAPGFDFRDFHTATPDEVAALAAAHPQFAAQIRALAPG